MMNLKLAMVGLSIAGALLTPFAIAPAAQAATAAAARPVSVVSAATGFTSTIRSPATRGCIDVPGGVADENVYILNSTCGAGLEERFDFVPVSAVAGAYAIVNRASSMCLTQYRSQPRQTEGVCVPVPSTIGSGALWYLVPLDATTHTYELQPVYRGGGVCLRAGTVNLSWPDGGRIPNLYETPCNSADATQSFVIRHVN